MRVTVDGLASTGGAVQHTNATAMVATGMMVTDVMASVVVVMVMMLVLTVNSSSTGVVVVVAVGAGSPLAAAVGVIE